MKDNFIHVCFVIDTSGSMGGSEDDIVGGFNSLVEEQKKVTEGECVMSMFTFGDDVKEKFIGKKLEDIKTMRKGEPRWSFSNANNLVLSENTEDKDDESYIYRVGGMTAMNDGIGCAIDKIGKWLDGMEESEKPSQNLIVIMTDGGENSSKDYTLAQVQEMIKHQTEKYNWKFVYMGMDITEKKTADSLGIKTRSFSSKAGDDMFANYHNVSVVASAYRCSSAEESTECMMSMLDDVLNETTLKYEAKLGIKIED